MLIVMGNMCLATVEVQEKVKDHTEQMQPAPSPSFSYTLTKQERGTGHEFWRIKSFAGCTTKHSIQMKNERTKGSMDIWHIKFFFNYK